MFSKTHQISEIKNPEVKLTVGYRRVSDERQINHASLDTQSSTIKKYCDQNGLTLIHIYEDKGISGREADNRQGYQEMIKVVKPGWFIIIYDTSRLNRNAQESINFYYDLRKIGCIIISATQAIDSRERDSELKWIIYAGIDREESNKISDRVKYNMNRLSEEGKLICRPPFGWKKNPLTRKLEEDSEQQIALARMIELYLSGINYAQISKKLNEEGLAKCLNNNKKKKVEEPKFLFGTVKNILASHGHVKEGEEKPKFLMRDRVEKWNSTEHKVKEKISIDVKNIDKGIKN